MHQHATPLDSSNEALNVSGTEAERPTDKLLEVIKCLKREKDILVAKVSTS
jgi:hypothetical protein